RAGAGGTPAGQRRHPPDERPGAREPLQPARSWPLRRPGGRGARPRPLRRHRGAGAGGAVARRRERDAHRPGPRRARPAAPQRRAHRRRAGAGHRPRRHPPRSEPRHPLRPRLSRPALRPRSRPPRAGFGAGRRLDRTRRAHRDRGTDRHCAAPRLDPARHPPLWRHDDLHSARIMIEARRLLASVFGFPEFRPGQEEVVAAVETGRDVLAIMPTGGGKSLCYQLPALTRPGVTVVISPLIALMRDQVRALRAAGVEAGALTSQTEPAEAEATFAAIDAGTLKLLYMAPERLSGGGAIALLK